MKIATQTSAMAKAFGDREAIRILADIGYDGLDISLFEKDKREMLDSPGCLEYAAALRGCADEYGITFRQSHAPFPSLIAGDDNYNEITRKRIERSIEVSGILGVSQIIIHPVTTGEDQKQLNIEFFKSLAPLCRETGVKIALENMFGWDKAADRGVPGACSPAAQFCEYLDELCPECFVACLDIGHAGITRHAYANGEMETAADVIRALGKSRLKSLHVHHNDNHKDMHTLPFLGALDWAEITKALREIEYDGDFTMEADGFLGKFPTELLADASVFMLKTARYLAGCVSNG